MRTMPRAASVAPTRKAIASLGLTAGRAAPRLMPTVSGVSPMTRYAASAGHLQTPAMRSTAPTAASALSGPSAVRAPAPNATASIGRTSQRLDRRRRSAPSHDAMGAGNAVSSRDRVTGGGSIALAMGRLGYSAPGLAPHMPQAASEPPQLRSPPCGLESEED